MSFLENGDSTKSANPPDAPRSFTNLMHDLQDLRLDWQILSSKEPHSLLQAETLNRYFNAAKEIEQPARETIRVSRQATSISARVEQLFYQIHMCYFQAHIYRFASLSQTVPKARRLRSFDAMKENLHSVINAFMTLKQLSPIPNVAWDIQQATMSSALLLAGIDRALETPESTELLQKLSRILPHCSHTVPEEETEEMAEASYCHGLATLDHIMNGKRKGTQTSPTSA
jgi:hypothetical protein